MCSLFKKYELLLEMFNLKQLIAHPTRITETTSSILDPILCNQSNKVSQSGT